MKNLFTAFGVFLSFSLFGQLEPPFFNTGDNPPPPIGEGPIIIIDKSTSGDTGGDVCISIGKNDLSNQGSRVLYQGSISLPVPLPAGTQVTTGSNTTSISDLILRSEGDNGFSAVNACSIYQYDFTVYYEWPDLPNCAFNGYTFDIEFTLLIDGMCVDAYLLSLDDTGCRAECATYIKTIEICPYCHPDKISLGFNKSNSNSSSVWPNPFINSLSLNINSEVSQIQLFDISGKQIQTEVITSDSKVMMDTNNVDSGVYMFRVIYQDGSNESFKVIKH